VVVFIAAVCGQLMWLISWPDWFAGMLTDAGKSWRINQMVAAFLTHVQNPSGGQALPGATEEFKRSPRPQAALSKFV